MEKYSGLSCEKSGHSKPDTKESKPNPKTFKDPEPDLKGKK